MPAPGTLMLSLFGLVALAFRRRKTG
ncbi:PEP-CTERM sorting domain-containing protein [Arsukibacterium sp.]